MNIRWDMLQPPDIGGQFQQGFAGAQRSALGMMQVQEAMQDRQRQQGLQSALTAAFDPATGQMDPRRAQAAYLQYGDPEGAMQVSRQQAEQRQALTEQQRETIRMGARIVRSVNPQDQAGWDRARAIAQQAGVDVSNVPPQFDPSFRDQILQAGEALEDSPEQTSFMREAAAGGIMPGTPEYRQLLENRYSPPIIDETRDGRRVITRRPIDGGGGGDTAPAPAVTTEEEYNALPPGSPYTDPTGRRRVKGGGAAPSGSNNFHQPL